MTEIEAERGGSKAIMSERGWAYLINDGNGFMPVLYGERGWTPEARAGAARVIAGRLAYLATVPARYAKFIVPEKAVVYPEYLPAVFSHLAQTEERPALMLQADHPGVVHYFGGMLADAKSFGDVYFRGDSHVTWRGGWLMYDAIAAWLQQAGLLHGPAIPFGALTASMAWYDGDLYTQVPPDERSRFDAAWGKLRGEYALEVLPKFDLPPERCQAVPVEPPAEYRDWFPRRELLAYQRSDGAGPRAVIFRDSTLHTTCRLLAQHFSRSVFIWHGGHVFHEVIERERPDVVLHVMAERFVTRCDGVPSVASAVWARGQG